MTITVSKIDRVAPEEAYMGNDKTYFTDSNGVSAYTFSKIFEGQSYEGFYKTDRKGMTQFKKESTFNQAGASQAQPHQAQAPVAQPQHASPSVDRFNEAVDKIVYAAEQLAFASNTLSQILKEQEKTETKPAGEDMPPFTEEDYGV